MNYIYIAYLDLQPMYVDPIPPSGVLPLYVGITQRFRKRMRQHERTKAWWGQLVDHVDHFEVGEDRAWAEQVEAKHIRLLAPVFNINDHPSPDIEWVHAVGEGRIRTSVSQVVVVRQAIIDRLRVAA